MGNSWLFRTRPKAKAPKRKKCPTPILTAYRRQAGKAALRRLKATPGSGVDRRRDRRMLSKCVCGNWHLTGLLETALMGPDTTAGLRAS